MAIGNILTGQGILYDDERVKAPKYKPSDITKLQADSIAGNQANLAGAKKLADETNQFNYDQLQKMLGNAIPGFADIQQQASGNILSELKGEIPKDVQDQIMRSSAFKSLKGGYGGGGMSDGVSARDLGLTRLDITNKGLDSATKWITLARTAMTPGQFDASNMFVSPGDRIKADLGEKQYTFQRDWLNEQVTHTATGFEGWVKTL